MTDEELIAWLRDLAAVLGKEAFTCAADRIEALVKERDRYFNSGCRQMQEIAELLVVKNAAEARAERLEAAMQKAIMLAEARVWETAAWIADSKAGHYPTNDADTWNQACYAINAALIKEAERVRAALKGDDHE